MRYAIATLGCKVNQYDTAIIEERLGRAGMERREFDESADVYVINTCTVTDRADVESLKFARRARRQNPTARVVMTGCLAQASPERLTSAVEVDAVVGLGRLEDLIRIAMAPAAEQVERVTVDDIRKHRAAIELEAVAPTGQTRAFLKLQEGCDQFCTFCIVPFSRGTSRSVEPRVVMATLDEMHGRGFKEVILTGVHLGGYGKDLRPRLRLEDLLCMIEERCPVGRVRLSSIDPEELSDEIIDIVAGSGKFCPHFHLPLQSGDDEILVRMRRRYGSAGFRALVERITSRIPQAAIGTDLIVGFPGESAAHFERYFEFVESLPLAYFHVFPYSTRSGTTAAKMKGRIRPEEIRRRSGLMRELGAVKRREFLQRFIGERLKVLVEGDRDRESGMLKGYSRNYIRVMARGDDVLKNTEVEVAGSVVSGTGLAGEIVWPASPTALEAAAAPAAR